jgi:hypothetical protein
MDNKPKITPHTWTGPEYSHVPKSVDWFWAIGLVAIVGFIITLFFHSYVFGIFILVSGGCLIFFGVRHPHEVTFTITADGINIAGKEYAYRNLKGFAIKEHSPWSKLLILTDGKFLPVHSLPIPEESNSEVYSILIQFIPELPLEESPSVIFMEKLGF